MATILVVEDELSIATMLGDVLEEAGYQVLLAKNGREALELLSTAHPAAVVTDMMMPIMDGWQFREAQLSNVLYADIPVVVVSATARVERPLDGISAFLKKPVNLEQLLDAVARHASVNGRQDKNAS